MPLDVGLDAEIDVGTPGSTAQFEAPRSCCAVSKSQNPDSDETLAEETVCLGPILPPLLRMIN
jgi:hypothetical protein